MKAEIICIGTELLLGEIVDTNAAYLAQCLAGLGIDLYYKATVGDNMSRVVDTLSRALERSDLVLTSGGLGPTLDDLTREAIAESLGDDLVLNNDALLHVESFFQRLQRPMSENNRRQALFPRCAVPIPNPMGTAPGVWAEKNGRIIVALPGVPRELKVMMEETVIPRLGSKIPEPLRKVLRSRVLRMVGIGESAMEERILHLIQDQGNPTIAPYAGDNEVRLRLTASAMNDEEAWRMVRELEDKVRSVLGDFIYGIDHDTLESVIIKRLASAGQTLAVAESCTGGLISHRLTNIPGSSAVFCEGAVTYDNRAKTARLQVPAELIEIRGAVSEEVARYMAEGIRQTSGCDFGLATTGIAGPGGGSDAKPTGLVYFAVSSRNGTRTGERRFAYDRYHNKQGFAQAALGLLWQTIRDGLPLES